MFLAYAYFNESTGDMAVNDIDILARGYRILSHQSSINTRREKKTETDMSHKIVMTL